MRRHLARHPTPTHLLLPAGWGRGSADEHLAGSDVSDLNTTLAGQAQLASRPDSCYEYTGYPDVGTAVCALGWRGGVQPAVGHGASRPG
jgi:hypothetical protein